MFLSIRLLVLIFLMSSLKVKGCTTPSCLNSQDSTQDYCLFFQSFLGTDSYTGYSQLKNELIRQSLFDDIDNFFITTGLSVGVNIPNPRNVSFGIHFLYYFTQNQYLNTDSTSRSLRLDGTSYGIFIEQHLKISRKIQFHFGLRFLRNGMVLSIYENSGVGNPNIAFNNSKGLEIEYKSNTINPYILFGYKLVSRNSYDLSMGISLDYKYILPKSPWKLSSSDVYDEWTYKNSFAVVDLPFFGNGVFGAGLFFTIRTYL
ncbi:MAG: hypothetical protein AAF600_08385 [Bacteroidota bacterium]